MNLSRKALSRDGELRTFKTTENTEAAFAGTEGVLGMRVFECSNAKKPRSTRLADLSSFRHDRSNAFWCHPIDNVENFKSAKLRSLESCVAEAAVFATVTPHDSQQPHATDLKFSPLSASVHLTALKSSLAKTAQIGRMFGGACLWFEDPEGLFLQPLLCRPNGRFHAFRGFTGGNRRGRSKNRETPGSEPLPDGSRIVYNTDEWICSLLLNTL